MMEAEIETCQFRAEDLESEALDHLYAYSIKVYDHRWAPVDPRLKQPCTRSFASILPDRCSQDYGFRTVDQVLRVFAVLKFTFIMRDPRSGNVYNSQELFLFTLSRISSVGATITSLTENGFGN